ncbi:MAG TPA: SPOR domain-containing protein [Balneolales bacterium]|nr:SPOR domain-containing protein [Balneolales bacterium]
MSPQQIAQQQVVQDSIARARANDMAQFALQKEREKMSKQKADTTTSDTTPKTPNISAVSSDSVANSFASSGNYTVQVGSWRYQKIAKKELKTWKGRGYRDAYIATYSKKSTGDVWYRVRLGRIQTYKAAEQAGKKIAQKFDVNFLVSYTE